jgi:hypothetical protein
MNEKLLRRIYSSPVDGFTIDLGAVVGIGALEEEIDCPDHYNSIERQYIKLTFVRAKMIGVREDIKLKLSSIYEINKTNFYTKDVSDREASQISKKVLENGELEREKLIKTWRES